MVTLKREDFGFTLPDELIALRPSEKRTESLLLTYHKSDNSIKNQKFKDILAYFKQGDCLVLNNTKVLKARLFGQKETGGQLECLVERVLDDKQLLVHLKASKGPKVDSLIHLGETAIFRVMDKKEGLYHIALETPGQVFSILDDDGHMPLPPYINRDDDDFDERRYQTVYAKNLGAVAAPTAGLHFDDALLVALKEKGVKILEVTLHVGAGTFQPVRVDDIKSHQMHSEWLAVSSEVVDEINQAKAKGNRIFAVGTTVVRSLETAAQEGVLKPYQGETNIFITPGFKFKVVDALITNFHLPESTLIMLVSAFIGHQQTLDLYQYAIDKRYRFYSYGDAMLLFPGEVL